MKVEKVINGDHEIHLNKEVDPSKSHVQELIVEGSGYTLDLEVEYWLSGKLTLADRENPSEDTREVFHTYVDHLLVYPENNLCAMPLSDKEERRVIKSLKFV